MIPGMRGSGQLLLAAIIRAVRRMVREQFTGTAAELAYYGLLSAAPSVTTFVGLLGLVGSQPDTARAVARIMREGVSSEAGAVAREATAHIVEHDGAAGTAIGLGVLTTLWVASLYVSAFRRAAYRVHGIDPGPTLRRRPLQAVLTLLALTLLALIALALVVTERLVRAVGDALGHAPEAVTIWSIARWPVTLAVVALVTAGLYSLAPRARGAGRRLTIGVGAAVLTWMAASLGFEVWVAGFADYDATYGALAGAIAFAVWLWISNLALLFGMVLDQELAPAPESRALESGRSGVP